MKQIIDQLLNNYHTAEDKQKKLDLGYELLDKNIQNGNYEDARNFGLETLQLASELGNKDLMIRILTEIGNSYVLQGEYPKSAEYFERAFYIADETRNHYQLATLYFYISKLETYSSNFCAAINFAFDAVKIAEEHGFNDTLEKTYYHIGIIYTDLKKYDLAIEYCKKSIKITKPEDKKGKFLCLGRIYHDLGDYTTAVGYAKRAISYYEYNYDFYNLVSCYILMTGIYYKQGKFCLAKTYASEALRNSDTHNLETLYADSILYLAEIYFAEGDIEKASIYFEKFKDNIENTKNKTVMLDFYDQYARYNKEIGNFEIAYEYKERYMYLKDMIQSQETMIRINFISENHEFEQKKKEAEIFKLKNVELAKSNKLIEEKNEELLELNEIKDNMVNTISHDLKNYLGSIQMALETALVKDSSLSKDKYFNMVRVSSRRALNLVKEILYMKKIEQTNDSVPMQNIDLNDFVRELEDDFTILVKNKDIELKIEYYPTPLMCMLDNDKFHRVIDNLFTNAMKFTHPNGNITIKINKSDDLAVISVKDSGIGIPGESIPKLFQRFSGVGRKGTAGEDSTGLGLYIVNKLVELHNGIIEVKSEIGKGTEFLVKIPVK